MRSTLDRKRPAMGPRGQKDWFRIENKAAEDTTDVYIFDEIGFWGVTAQNFVDAMRKVDTSKVDVHMNTPGGDIFDGIAIHNALVLHDAYVRVFVEGIAASAGSFIAQAGDERIMVQFSQMMIHDGIGFAVGNEEDMLEMAELLGRQSDNIAAIYANRGGGSRDAWRALMRAETWFSAEEAVEAKLADNVLERTSEDGNVEDLMSKYDLSMYNYHGREEAPAPELDRLGLRVVLKNKVKLKATVIGSTTLPIHDDRGKSWSGSGATQRMLDAGSATARRGHLYLDPDGDPETAAAYKLPFADVIDGTLKIIANGVVATAGGRGVNAANIPEAEKATIRNKVCTMYSRLQAKFDDFPDCPFNAGGSEDVLDDRVGHPPAVAAQEEEPPPDEDQPPGEEEEEEKEDDDDDETFDPGMMREALAQGAEDPALPEWGAETFKEAIGALTSNAPASRIREDSEQAQLGLAQEQEGEAPHEATLADLFRESVSFAANEAPAPTEPEPEPDDEPSGPAEAPPVQQEHEEESTLAGLFRGSVEHAASGAPAPTEAEPEKEDDEPDLDMTGFAEAIREVVR